MNYKLDSLIAKELQVDSFIAKELQVD